VYLFEVGSSAGAVGFEIARKDHVGTPSSRRVVVVVVVVVVVDRGPSNLDHNLVCLCQETAAQIDCRNSQLF